MFDCYDAITRHLRGLGPEVQSCSYTFGELHKALGMRLPMGAEIASSWNGAHAALGRAVAAAGFRAELVSTDKGWVVTFTRRQRVVS